MSNHELNWRGLEDLYVDHFMFRPALERRLVFTGVASKILISAGVPRSQNSVIDRQLMQLLNQIARNRFNDLNSNEEPISLEIDDDNPDSVWHQLATAIEGSDRYQESIPTEDLVRQIQELANPDLHADNEFHLFRD